MQLYTMYNNVPLKNDVLMVLIWWAPSDITYTYTHTTYTPIHVSTYTHTCTHTHRHTHTHARTHTHTYMYTHTHTYTHAHTCRHTHTYTHNTQMRTRTCTHKRNYITSFPILPTGQRSDTSDHVHAPLWRKQFAEGTLTLKWLE